MKYPSNEYLLVKLMEECGEVTQVAAKTHCFGFDFQNPKTGDFNRTELADEIGDVLGLVDMLADRGLIDIKRVQKKRAAKAAKVLKWHRRSTERKA